MPTLDDFVSARQRLTFADNPEPGDSVTVGGVVYTFQNATSPAGVVAIGDDEYETRTNLVAALLGKYVESGQLLSSPDDFTNAAWSTQASATRSLVAGPGPYGAAQINRLEDDSPSQGQSVRQIQTRANRIMGVRARVFVRKQVGGPTAYVCAEALRALDGARCGAVLQVDPSNGRYELSAPEDVPDLLINRDGGVGEVGDYWFVQVEATFEEPLETSHERTIILPASRAPGEFGPIDSTVMGYNDFALAHLDSITAVEANPVAFARGDNSLGTADMVVAAKHPGAQGDTISVAEDGDDLSWGGATLLGGGGQYGDFIEDLIASRQINAEVATLLREPIWPSE